MNATIINAVRNAALFSADKYRKATDLLQRFNDERAPDMKASECNYRRIVALSADVQSFNPIDKALVATALNAYADDLNRKAQMLSDKYQTEAAAITMTKLREIYAAVSFVTTGAESELAATAGDSGEA